jgi:hypothetical protein
MLKKKKFGWNLYVHPSRGHFGGQAIATIHISPLFDSATFDPFDFLSPITDH